MTPTNTAMTPEIKNIADNNGDKHTVIPTPHNHSQDEVNGLVTALATKADTSTVNTALAGKQNTLTFDSTPTASSTNPVTSGGVKAALDGKRTLVGKTISFVINGQEIEIEPSDVPNLIRALSTPDSTPTENSDKLITSGGVKTALNTKANATHSHNSISSDENNSVSVSDGAVIIELNDGETGGELEMPVEKLGNLQRAINAPDSTPTANSDNLVTSGGVKAAIEKATDVIISDNPLDMSTFEKKRVYTAILTNTTGDAIEVGEYLDVSNLPSDERNIIFNASMIDVPDGEVFGIRFIRTNQGVYAFFDGILAY